MFNIVNLLAIETSQIFLYVVIALLVVAMIVVPMFTNRKKQKEVNDMYDSLSVGDEIMTIGGIMGTIVELKTHESGEKLMVIETGEGKDKATMTFTIQALRLNYTRTKRRQEELAKEKAEKEAAKNKPEEQEKEPTVVVEAEEAKGSEAESVAEEVNESSEAK